MVLFKSYGGEVLFENGKLLFSINGIKKRFIVEYKLIGNTFPYWRTSINDLPESIINFMRHSDRKYWEKLNGRD